MPTSNREPDSDSGPYTTEQLKTELPKVYELDTRNDVATVFLGCMQALIINPGFYQRSSKMAPQKGGLHEWSTNMKTGILIVNDPYYRSLDFPIDYDKKMTPATYAMAQAAHGFSIIATTIGVKRIVLHHFCGLHPKADDEESGIVQLARSLLRQLFDTVREREASRLKASRHLSFLGDDPELVKQMQRNSLEHILTAVRRLIISLAKMKVSVSILVDLTDEFMGKESHEPSQDVIYFLKWLVETIEFAEEKEVVETPKPAAGKQLVETIKFAEEKEVVETPKSAAGKQLVETIEVVKGKGSATEIKCFITLASKNDCWPERNWVDVMQVPEVSVPQGVGVFPESTERALQEILFGDK